MGTAVDVNGTSYTVPAVGEGNWGAQVSSLLIALSSGLLQRKGGSFTLTADVDFGATHGLKAFKFSSRNTPAVAGVVRLGNNESVSWRDAGNTADKTLKLNASDILEFDGSPMLTLALGAANTVLKMNAGGTAYEFGLLANANIDASAAIDATKIGNADVDNTELSYLNGVTSSVQTQLNAKLDDFTSSTDNRIMRTDGTAGEAIQESLASIDDSGNISGLANITMSGALDMATAVTMNIGATNATTINIGRSGQMVVLPGNLQVDGTTTTVNSETLDVTDANITVNNTGNQASANNTAGLTVEMSDATDVVLIYDSTLTARFKIGDSGSEQEIVTTGHAQTITALKTINTELLVKQIATPSNPASGYNKIYPKTDDKLYYLNSAGLEQEIGSGSGSGAIDFIENGDFEDGTTTGWATYDDGASATPVDGTGGVSSNITISNETTTVLNGVSSFKIAKAAADAQGEGASYAFPIPKGYRNIKNAISFIYATDGSYAAGDAAIFLYDVDTSTLITPRISEITGYDKDNPGAVKYRTDFSIADTTSVNYRLIVHVTSTNASAWDLYLDDIGVGPETISQGPVVGDSVSFTPTYNNGPTVPQERYAFYQPVGDCVHIMMDNEGNTGGAAAILSWDWPVPNVLPNIANGDVIVLGDLTGEATTNNTGSVTGVWDSANSRFDLYWGETSANGTMTTLNGNSFTNNRRMVFDFKIPIAEWAGKTVANLGANDVEYAYNIGSETAAGASNTIDFEYGENGTTINSFDSTTAGTFTTLRVQFQTAIQPTDVIKLQVDMGAGNWIDIGETFAISSALSQSTSVYGMGFNPVSSTQVDVRFGNKGRTSNNATYAGNGATWAGVSTWKWRVVKHRSGIPVGFGLADADNAGLVKKGKFQTKYLSSDITASGTVTDLTFNNLVVGNVYEVSLTAFFNLTGTSATESVFTQITHNSAVLGTARHRNDGQSDDSASAQSIVVKFVAVATTLTFVFSEAGTGNMSGDGSGNETFAQLTDITSQCEETTDFT